MCKAAQTASNREDNQMSWNYAKLVKSFSSLLLIAAISIAYGSSAWAVSDECKIGIDWSWGNDHSFKPLGIEVCGTVGGVPVGFISMPWGGTSHKDCVVACIIADAYGDANMALNFLACSQRHNPHARAVIEANGYEAVRYAVATYGPQVNIANAQWRLVKFFATVGAVHAIGQGGSNDSAPPAEPRERPEKRTRFDY
jgi:hypothetical protein